VTERLRGWRLRLDAVFVMLAVPTCPCAPWDPWTTAIAPSCARPLSPWERSAASSATRLVLARSPPSACRTYEPPTEIRKGKHADGRMGQRGQHN
jgi:hypothetical protein